MSEVIVSSYKIADKRKDKKDPALPPQDLLHPLLTQNRGGLKLFKGPNIFVTCLKVSGAHKRIRMKVHFSYTQSQLWVKQPGSQDKKEK